MGTVRISEKAFAAAMAAFAAAMLLAFTLVVPQAWAENRQLDAPVTVSDDTTHVQVNKLDPDTRDYVQGASMAIIEKDTGLVVDEWVTGSSSHQNEKVLDVDKVYILRELAAPDGYDTAQDVEFKINSEEGKGLEILSQGNDSELVESYKINMYDKKQPVEKEIVEERTNTPSKDKETTSRAVAPKTGDETPLWLIELLVAAGVVAIVALEVAKRVSSRETQDDDL